MNLWLEIFALSGYAYLFSEYHQDPSLWGSCTRTWDVLFDLEDGQIRLKALANLVGATVLQPILTSRSFLRSRWKQEFEHEMRKLPLDRLSNDGDHHFHHYFVRKHPSLVIRALIGTEDLLIMHHDPIDVFVDIFLREHLNLEQLEDKYFPNIRDEFAGQKEREAMYDYNFSES